MRATRLLVILLAAPASGLAIGRRACLLCAGGALLPKAASASYALGVANVAGQSWQATGKDAEARVYQSIDSQLDEKRRFRDDAGTLGYVGGEYTNYRRGSGRDKFDEERRAGKASTSVSSYARAEDFIIVQNAKRMANP